MRRLPDVPCWQLRCWYEEDRLGVAAIARQVGCSPATISNWLRRCAIPARSGRFRARSIDRCEFERLYLEEALPLVQIAAAFGVSIGTINNRRRAYGLPPRRVQSRRAPWSAPA